MRVHEYWVCYTPTGPIIDRISYLSDKCVMFDDHGFYDRKDITFISLQMDAINART